MAKKPKQEELSDAQKQRQAEMAHAAAVSEKHGTLHDYMEPNVAQFDGLIELRNALLLSIAISLKRIADKYEAGSV